jgi:hypothetical protein
MSQGGALIAGAGSPSAGTQGRLIVGSLGLDIQFTVVEAGSAGLRIRFADAPDELERLHAALARYDKTAA